MPGADREADRATELGIAPIPDLSTAEAYALSRERYAEWKHRPILAPSCPRATAEQSETLKRQVDIVESFVGAVVDPRERIQECGEFEAMRESTRAASVWGVDVRVDAGDPATDRSSALVPTNPAHTIDGSASTHGQEVPDACAAEDLYNDVTLNQAAAIVSVSKRTLERYKKKGLPDPIVEGGGGRASLYRWSDLRPWLEFTFRKKLPAEFPANRRHV